MSDVLTEKKLKAKLADLEKRSYIPHNLVHLISVISTVQQNMRSNINPRALKIKVTAAQHAAGAPLVLRTDFTWNKKQAEQLFKKLLKAVVVKGQETTDPVSQGAMILSSMLSYGEMDLGTSLSAVLSEEVGVFENLARKTPATPDIALFLCNCTLAPFIEKQAAALAEEHKEKIWQHGHCPICGTLPFMGKLDGKEGHRMHTCAFCQTTYRVPRLQCAFCLREHSDGAPVYTAEEDRYFQVYPCDNCKTYIKIADFRELDRAYVPAIDDVISLPLDIKALELGYARPARSAWGV